MKAKSTTKMCFFCLLAIFSVSFIIEFICTATGNPISQIEIIGLDLEKQDMATYLLRSFISSLFISGLFNFFLTVKVIKEARGIDRLPAVAVVIMTLLFPLELIISCVFVIPNIIIFGIIGIKKST